MSDTAIKVENLSKRYRIGPTQQQHDTLRDALMAAVKSPIERLRRDRREDGRDDEIWALRDVSFEVARGEVLGIIGRNGAGKSTLLKILSRITQPTEGRAVINGRVGSLLEVGTGFHPELTGRENIYLNGAILGMTRAEIERKFDEIVDFSGVEKFIDMPVKRYSSGMRVRLAFSVAAHLDPEILLIDEVLAVGDAAFQEKCLGKMGDVARGGRTVLFVSHNMTAIGALCNSAVLLDQGRVTYSGGASLAVEAYLDRTLAQSREDSAPSLVTLPCDPEKPIQIREIALTDGQGAVKGVYEYVESPEVVMVVDVRETHQDYVSILTIRDSAGTMLLHTGDNDTSGGGLAGARPGRYCYRVSLPDRLLKPGRYLVSARIKTQAHRGTRVDIDVNDSVLAFEILDTVTRRGRENRYPRETLVAPAVAWNLEQVQAYEMARGA